MKFQMKYVRHRFSDAGLQQGWAGMTEGEETHKASATISPAPGLGRVFRQPHGEEDPRRSWQSS